MDLLLKRKTWGSEYRTVVPWIRDRERKQLFELEWHASAKFRERKKQSVKVHPHFGKESVFGKKVVCVFCKWADVISYDLLIDIISGDRTTKPSILTQDFQFTTRDRCLIMRVPSTLFLNSQEENKWRHSVLLPSLLPPPRKWCDCSFTWCDVTVTLCSLLLCWIS